MKINELITLDAGSGVRRTSDGYLVAAPRVARTGIQEYKGFEVGKPELAVVRVYRPEAEVFSKDSLATYAHRPLTNDHPPSQVDAKNWKKFAVGVTGDDVARDGEFIRVPLLFMDAQAIEDIESGKAQLSLGYTTDLKWEAGKLPSGEAYDAIQTEIRANHLALVRQARGGPALRVGDSEGRNMELRNIVVDGITVQVSDTSAQVIEQFLKRQADASKTREERIAELEEELKALRKKGEKDAADAAAAHTTAIGTKDAEIATLKTQLADARKVVEPAALDALVKDRAQVVGKAKVILGDKLVVDGKTEAEIRKQVVAAKMGDTAKDWTDAMITASFNTLTADVKPATNDSLAAALGHTAANAGTDVRDAAYNDRDKALNNAWRGPQPTRTQ